VRRTVAAPRPKVGIRGVIDSTRNRVVVRYARARFRTVKFAATIGRRGNDGSTLGAARYRSNRTFRPSCTA